MGASTPPYPHPRTTKLLHDHHDIKWPSCHDFIDDREADVHILAQCYSSNAFNPTMLSKFMEVTAIAYAQVLGSVVLMRDRNFMSASIKSRCIL